MQNEINEILRSRESVYGPYKLGVEVRADMMRAIQQAYDAVNGHPMAVLYEGFFWDILNKLARLAITPSHRDSWVDIIGYTTRILETLEEMEHETKSQCKVGSTAGNDF